MILKRNGDEVLLSVKEPVDVNARVYTGDNILLGKVVKMLGPVSDPMAILKLRDAKVDLDKIGSVYFR